MTCNKSFYFTKEGLGSLKKELAELIGKKRPKLVKRVAEARSKGDLSENSEYTSARDELDMMDGRIEELEIILSKAKLIRQNSGAFNKVSLGCQVTVESNGKTHVYHVVGEREADPLKKKISYSSPLGKGLLGKRVGQKVEIEAPIGKVVYKIKKIH